jgi:hypothetical protein
LRLPSLNARKRPLLPCVAAVAALIALSTGALTI